MISKSSAIGLLATLICIPSVSSPQDRLELNLVTYQPPAGFIEYLNENIPQTVLFNTSDWVAISDADIAVYFLSDFEARYEITDFGSKILDTIDLKDGSAVVTQSVNVEGEDRNRYLVFVSAGKFEYTSETIVCNAANAVLNLVAAYTQNFNFEFSDCL